LYIPFAFAIQCLGIQRRYWELQGFGWAIAKALAEAGAEISLGVWVSIINDLFHVMHERHPIY
jgi:enoyl-[acyl-carrier-protein] reductase (NADH)